MGVNQIINIDCRQGLQELEEKSVHCCVTSPPYYGLRDYGVDGQIGLEETPEQYVEKIVEVFRHVRRVLRDDGTLWLNLGDSYCGTGTGSGTQVSSTLQGGKKTQIEAGKRPDKKPHGDIKQKDLIGIPWMVAFALRADGWYLRQDIIWSKPNPMPESVTDRCTKSHEYIFLMSKSKKYYYDQKAILQPVTTTTTTRINQPNVLNQNGSDRVPGKTNGNMKASWRGSSFDRGKTGNKERKNRPGAPECTGKHQQGSVPWEGEKANKKSVWMVTTKPFSEAHFATFPEELIVDMIKAGCPENGIVLDPFMGAGTTALVARKLNRNFIGFELNSEYIKIANKRLDKELGMFK